MGFAWITWYDYTDDEYKAELDARKGAKKTHDHAPDSLNEMADCGSRIADCGDRGVRSAALERCRVLALAAAPLVAQSQSTELHIKFKSGQGVVPDLRRLGARARRQLQHGVRLLEPEPCAGAGRSRSARRTASTPVPPIAGQPTYFYPRENHFLFKVNVPKDWDRKKELVWTLTVERQDRTRRRATLLDIWEIDRKVEVSNNGGGVQTSNELIARISRRS